MKVDTCSKVNHFQVTLSKSVFFYVERSYYGYKDMQMDKMNKIIK